MNLGTRFENLPERTVFWFDGGMYETTGGEHAEHQATGRTVRFYRLDRVYPLGIADADEDEDSGSRTDPTIMGAAV